MTDASPSQFRNNVTRLLESRKIHYRVHVYDYDDGVHSAVEVAQAVGLPPERVYKTLVVVGDDPGRKPLLILIPGAQTLDLKALAKAARLKKACMAAHDEAESLTGLQTGGISALALINKGFEVYLDDKARSLDKIAVSAGVRGANIELAVADLVALTRAKWAELG